MSKKTYDAVRRSGDLDARDRAVVNAFCSVVTQVADNGERPSEAQYIDRIVAQAEAEVGEPGSILIRGRVNQLRATYDLAQINGRAAQLYAQSCFGKRQGTM